MKKKLLSLILLLLPILKTQAQTVFPDGLKINFDKPILFDSGNGGFSTIIDASGYPSKGWPNNRSDNYWIRLRSLGGTHIVLNTDGVPGSPENPYDHLTIWQGNVDGDKLFSVTNIGRGYLRNTLGIGIEKTTVGASATSSEGQSLNPLLQLHSNASGVNPTLHISAHNTDEASLLLTENTENNAYGARLFYDGNSGSFFKIAIGDRGTWTDRFVIHRNGNIGAGTQVPQADFHLKSARANMYIENTDPSNWAYLRIQGPTTNFWDIGQYGDSEHLQFRPRGQSVNRVVFKQNGNVGIGISDPDPSHRLTVYEEEAHDIALFNGNTINGLNQDRFNRILVQNRNGQRSWIGLEGSGSQAIGYLGLEHKENAINPVITWDKSGNVSIGKSISLNPSDGIPSLYTGKGGSEFNRYLQLLNSKEFKSASGLKAGGILVSDAYNYASPGKNNLIVKGKIAVGTSSVTNHALTVNGTIQAKEIKVSLDGLPAPDYVFEKDYDLKSLGETQTYIQENGHLPGVPSAETMENEGLDLKKMNMILLQKIEELTLHAIQQQQKIDNQNKEMEYLKNQNKTFQEKVDKIDRLEKLLLELKAN
ncbi:hypothetical protein FUAX_53080 (plasmid) [Fulvitalea axinellae]|uniref:Peptidase S74 domain-containing protein n=1 Tax=Fulvitalea axinellae TaxID=1182444 RepID=A0AAU9CLJ6_9BACT|nr:hypothetical protein FUAX_53080 [Fulvitalea axinellae]